MASLFEKRAFSSNTALQTRTELPADGADFGILHVLPIRRYFGLQHCHRGGSSLAGPLGNHGPNCKVQRVQIWTIGGPVRWRPKRNFLCPEEF